MEAETEVEAMEGHLLTGLLSLLFHSTQDDHHRGGTGHRELGPPTLIKRMPTGQSCGAFSQLRFPFPKGLWCKTSQHSCKDFVMKDLEPTGHLEASPIGCLSTLHFQSLGGGLVALWGLTS